MSRPGLRWTKWRSVSCKHSHGDVGTRSSRVGEAMNKSPDATLSDEPGVTRRGGAALSGAGCAARARKEDATRGRDWRESGVESAARRCRSALGSPRRGPVDLYGHPIGACTADCGTWGSGLVLVRGRVCHERTETVPSRKFGRGQTGELGPQTRRQEFPSLSHGVEPLQEIVPLGWWREGRRCCSHTPTPRHASTTVP